MTVESEQNFLPSCLPLATLFGGAVLFAARKGHIINGKKIFSSYA